MFRFSRSRPAQPSIVPPALAARTGAALALALLIATPALAQSSAPQMPGSAPNRRPLPYRTSLATDFTEGWYISGVAGLAHVNGQTTNYNDSALGGSNSAPTLGASEGNRTDDWENGFAVHAAAGYAVARFLRLEAEIGYQRADLGKTASRAGPITKAGSIGALSLMLNVRANVEPLAFSIGSRTIMPYVGGGVGMAYVDLAKRTQSLPNSLGETTVDSARLGLAYQVLLGVTTPIAPRTTLDIGYRYFGTEAVSLKRSITPTTLTASRAPTSIDSHEMLVGLRYDF